MKIIYLETLLSSYSDNNNNSNEDFLLNNNIVVTTENSNTNVNLYHIYKTESIKKINTLNLELKNKENSNRKIKKLHSKKIPNEYKQFFLLLFQSLKLNNQCKIEHIPYYKYEKWIIKKLKLDKYEEINQENKENEFENIFNFITNRLF